MVLSHHCRSFTLILVDLFRVGDACQAHIAECLLSLRNKRRGYSRCDSISSCNYFWDS